MYSVVLGSADAARNWSAGRPVRLSSSGTELIIQFIDSLSKYIFFYVVWIPDSGDGHHSRFRQVHSNRQETQTSRHAIPDLPQDGLHRRHVLINAGSGEIRRRVHPHRFWHSRSNQESHPQSGRILPRHF